MAKPSVERLREASAELLIFNPAPIDLPAGNDMLFTFQMVGEDPRFKKLAFAAIDHRLSPPKTFLHLPDQVWNCGSAIKVAIAAGAFVLRRDVQALLTKGLVADLQEADDIMRHVWSVSDQAAIRGIGLPSSFPLPSRVLEFDGADVIFQGQHDPDDFTKLAHWHWDTHGITVANLQRATFWEQLILMVKASDNKAARAIQGAIGVRYNVHAIEALGLFSAAQGGLRPAGTFAKGPRFRDLGGLRQPGEYWNGWAKGRILNGQQQKIGYGATPRAFAALMNAILARGFLDPPASSQFDFLLHEEGGLTVSSKTVQAIEAFTGETIEAWTKIGIWKNRAEFARIEIASSGLKYGMVILGLPDTGGATTLELAVEVHRGMAAIHP